MLVDHADARRASPARTGGDVAGRRRWRSRPGPRRSRPRPAARARACPRDPLRTTLRAGRLEGGGHLVGPDRDRGGVAGDEHPVVGAVTATPPSARRAARATAGRAGGRRACPDGPSAQLPRQKTSSTSTSAPRLAGPRRASRRTAPRPRPTGRPRRGRARRCARRAARCGSPCRSVTTPCTSATERFSTSAIASTSSRATWPSSSTTSWSTGIRAPRSARCCVAMARTSATRSVVGRGRHQAGSPEGLWRTSHRSPAGRLQRPTSLRIVAAVARLATTSQEAARLCASRRRIRRR